LVRPLPLSLKKLFDEMNPRLFLFLAVGFMFFTVFGTLSHEFGHFAVARFLGYPAKISYGSTYNSDANLRAQHDTIMKKYEKEYKADLAFPGKEKFEQDVAIFKSNDLYIRIGGPIQTILTSLIAIILILINLDSFKNYNSLNFGKWLLVFFALFSLRQPANLFIGIIGYLFSGKFSNANDEARIDFHLALPPFTSSIITSILSLSIFAYIFFKVIPKPVRITFAFAGLVGGVLGFYLWFYALGPILLPVNY
jgi:hypothetical protein